MQKEKFKISADQIKGLLVERYGDTYKYAIASEVSPRTKKDPILVSRHAEGFGWYAVNWNYALDLTGRIRKACLKNWKTCTDENGHTMKWNARDGRLYYFDKTTGKKVDQ